MKSFARAHLPLIATFVCLTAQEAKAQVINQYFPQGIPGYDTGLGVTVQSRARNQYSAPGVQLGEIIIKPTVNESVGYNSNVTGTSTPQGSLQIDTSLNLQTSTDWSRNGLFTSFSLDQLTFPDLPSQNQTSWIAAIGGIHEFGNDQLNLAYSHFNLQQTAADIGSLNYQSPETFTIDDVRSGYKIDLGRVSITPSIQVSNFTFDQASLGGVQSSQQYRNRVLTLGSVALSYAFAPQRNAIFVVSGYDTHYTSPQFGQPIRDNSGLSILAGLEYTANGVFRYRGLIGFEQRMYASGIYNSQGTPVGEGEVIWTPTELTTATLSVQRAIEDAASEASVGYTYTTGRLVIDHEYRRNILLQAYGGVQSASFAQGGGSQTITSAGGSVSWLLNRNIRFAASYDFTSSNVTSSPTNFVGNNYQRNVYLLRVSFTL
jgi:hypothetical protein